MIASFQLFSLILYNIQRIMEQSKIKRNEIVLLSIVVGINWFDH